VDYLNFAMNLADSLGADYADIRIQKTTEEQIYLRNFSQKMNSKNIIYGYGIRVLKDGAWGFAHSNIFSKEAVGKTVERALAIAKASGKVKVGNGIILAHERSYIDTYRTPIKVDPFDIPLKEKIELMTDVNRTMLNYDPIKLATFYLISRKDFLPLQQQLHQEK
jgi:TldD protein